MSGSPESGSGKNVFAAACRAGLEGDLRARLEPLRRAESPFVPPPRGIGGAWSVEPRLVGVVRFTEWTADGKRRHPSFQGLREDKPAHDVVRERERPS